jgi:hypothetical protein
MAIAVLALAVASVGPAQAQTPKPNPLPESHSPDEELKREEVVIVERAMHDANMAKEAAKFAAESVKFRMGHFFGHNRNHELDGKIRQAAAQVRDATDDAARAAATADLIKLMDQYFEADIRVREQELADIAARLEKLRAQLDRRREKKSEIIDLQVKVAINEADGLGFYSQPKEDTMFDFRVPAPVMVSPSGDVLMPPPAAIPVPPQVPASADAPPAGTTIPR